MATGLTLWKKLDEFGYECNNLEFRFYKGYDDINVLVAIFLDSTGDEIQTFGIVPEDNLYDQEMIDRMQIAYNRLKKEVKDLKQ